MKQNYLFSTTKRKNISDDTIRILVHNARSFSKHVGNKESNDRIIYIIGITETQIILIDSTWKIIKTFNFFIIDFNSNENKCLRLTYGCRNVVVSDEFDVNRVFTFSFEKYAFVDRVFTIMLVYRKRSLEV